MTVLRKNIRRTAALWVAAGSLLVSGCEFKGLYEVPLPGGAAADNAYHVTVDFKDVLDLVPQSSVKVNNVTVGSVEKVELKGWQARVKLRIDKGVKLPSNAVAELHQTSILGEKYVALSKPTAVQPVGRLADGDRIPVARSNRTPEIEEVLSALSALLNGGGVAQLHTINKELNNALQGREDRVKNLLTELDTFVGSLDNQRSEIVRALKGVDRLSARLNAEKKTIGEAIDTMPGALKVLADQRHNLTHMLTSLNKLGQVGTHVINQSKDDTVANLRQLEPILHNLNKAGNDLPNALELMTSFPFPRNAPDTIKGDYTNLYVTADMDLKNLYGNLAGGDQKNKPGDGGGKGLPDTPGLPNLPGSPDKPSNPDNPKDPGLPGVGGIGGLAGQSSYESTGTGTDTGPPEGYDPALAELMMGGMPS